MLSVTFTNKRKPQSIFMHPAVLEILVKCSKTSEQVPVEFKCLFSIYKTFCFIALTYFMLQCSGVWNFKPKTNYNFSLYDKRLLAHSIDFS